jgi:RNA polymerase sigma-70 factor, ECF subfamily
MSARGSDDQHLISAAQAGNESAFAALVHAYAPRLHRYLVATGVGHHDADDLVQDAFLRVHRHLANYDARYAFTTWLFTIGHRLRLNWVARRRPQAALESIAEPAASDDDQAETIGVWAIAQRVLSERHFQILWLRYGEDQELDAIAHISGISSINVRVTLHRARAKLEGHLRAEGLAPIAAGGTT